jgi:peptidyl-prolyl cis-trans isomerase D
MLQQMRRFASTWVSSLFLGAVALSFIVWGVADIFRGSTDATAYTVGSTDVQIDSFAREYHNTLRNLGGVIPPAQTKLVEQAILDRMMAGTALENLTNTLGLTASDARVREQIQQIPQFIGPTGTFDHDAFLRVIGQSGYTEEDFVSAIRRDSARSQLVQAIQGGFAMPSDYARALFSYIEEVRAADYIVLTSKALGPIAPPSDMALAAYVKAHPEKFSTPEYRAVSYAGASLADVAAGITVTPDQIKQERDANKSLYDTPEKRDLEQLTFPTENEAKAAKAAIDGGKTFDAIALERKIKPADYQFGTVAAADLDDARSKAFFALPENGVSAPVKSTFGWVLMHVTKITPGTSKPDDVVKADVQKALADAKMSDMANAFTDAISGGGTIEEAAHKAGMKFQRIAAVDAQGLDPNGQKVGGAADDPGFLKAVFTAEVGEDGDPSSTPAGNVYAVKVDGITPPKVKPIDAVRVQALAAWTGEQAAIQLKAKAAALAASINSGAKLEDVAKQLGVTVQKSPALTRLTKDPAFPPGLLRAIYGANAGAATTAPSADGGYVVARVTGILRPVPNPADATYQAGVRQLSNDISQDFALLLAKAIQAKDGAKVNQKLIDATVGGSNSGS